MVIACKKYGIPALSADEWEKDVHRMMADYATRNSSRWVTKRYWVEDQKGISTFY